MNITKVLGSRVLVKVNQEEVKSESDAGLAVSATSVNPNYFTGTVLQLGPYISSEKNDGISVGDKVAFAKYGYEDMGDGQYLVEENSLFAVYE